MTDPQHIPETLKIQRIARITEAIKALPEVNSVEIEMDYGDSDPNGVNRVRRIIVHYHGFSDEPVIVELY